MLPVWSAISTVLSELRDKQIFIKRIRVRAMRSDLLVAGNQFPGKGDLAFKRRPVLCNPRAIVLTFSCGRSLQVSALASIRAISAGSGN